MGAKQTHGKTGTKVYRAWKAMRSRCLNPNAGNFEDYGGRGITVCDRWVDSFENFYADMGDPPSWEYSLDRINCEGNYTPSNCRWADYETQCNNKRSSHFVEFKGVKLSLSQWERRLGLKPFTLTQRLTKLGWTIERALTTPIRQCRRTSYA